MTNLCRWGILGAANIARKNWKAMRLAGNAQLVAVASRDRSKAEQFIAECQAEAPFPQAPVACTYEQLLERPDIDAVYIPLPTGIRPPWVIRAAQARKHVLCEKPCAPHADQLRDMLQACRQNNVLFMDGVMFMHSQRLQLLRRLLDDGHTIGTLRRINSQFSFAAPPEFLRSNIRVQPQLEPLGALGDLGWYNIRLSLWILKYEMPIQVTARILYPPDNFTQAVPLELAAELLFADQISASFYCSFRTELQQWAHISGSNGSIWIDDFVLPYYGAEVGLIVSQPYFRVVGCSFNMENHSQRYAVREYSDGVPGAQEVNMIRNFSLAVLSGRIEPQWSEIAWKTQVVLDACLRSARQHGQPVTINPSDGLL
ncbi:MAG: Gfo/Idh/MocA family oxidoreductase [Gemmataceae bacterium]|nr:Gfo/Idh/MocA family oxidoreductase [Gemmataceae bacterium]MCS7271391.1 Gfo/Idh/MocA family oxidoreductase [Gemmataceae bacterium]MDW8241596.1 Gfo/Idh/MocA family oxidoreductase [Thermogemmata sp.]